MKVTLLLLAFCLILANFADAKKNWGGKNKKHRGDGGHPLRNHLYPRWNNFDAAIPPTAANNEPVQVEVNMYIREIGPINLAEKSYRLQVTLRQVFNDTRLSFNANMDYITLTGDEVDSIWTPDTFIRNERKVIFHDGLKPNNYARISANGNIIISQRVTLELSCPNMKDLEETGKTTCGMDIASYGLTEKDIGYVWKEDNPIQVGQDSEAFLNDGISLANYDTERCDVATSTGKYSCIRINFNFESSEL